MEVGLTLIIIALIAVCTVFIALYIITNQKNSYNLEQVSTLKKEVQTYEQKSQNLQSQIDKLKTENLQTLSNLQNNLHNLAGDKFQEWREKECENIRKQEQEVALQLATSQFQNWMFEAEMTIRNDAIQKSHSTIIGQVSEHIVPFMPNFCFNPKDVRFVGSPIDLIIFNGMDDDEIEEIVFVEVKTGESANLSPRQRQIREAVKNHRVRWEIFRVPRKTIQTEPRQNANKEKDINISRATKIHRKPVNSSNLESIGYDATYQLLEIEFNSGSVYQYYGVPESIYQGLMSASSHGQYFDREIKKGGYSYNRIG